MKQGWFDRSHIFCLQSLPEIEEEIECESFGKGVVKRISCDGTWNWIEVLLLETLQGEQITTWKFAVHSVWTSEARALRELQSQENNGRGVSCVRNIADELDKGDFQGAKSAFMNENDKIRQYPTIQAWLNKFFELSLA